jgi:hypothetical protein
MALKNAYKNKLMNMNNRNSLQSNIQNSTQPIQNESQNIESGLSNEAQAQSTTPNYANNTAINNYGWQDYSNLINAKTANPKAELQTAMQRAQNASNEYLKALGLAGSGMGQSQLSDIGVQYQNALSKINQTAQDEVNAQLNSDFEGAVSSGRYSARDVQNYINRYGEQTGLSEAWQNAAENNGATYAQEADRVFGELNKIIDGDTYELTDHSVVNVTDKQKKFAKDLRAKLNEAYANNDEELFYGILDNNIEFLNNLSTASVVSAPRSTKTNANTNVNIPEKYETIPQGVITDTNVFKLYKEKQKWFKINGEDIYVYYDGPQENGIKVIKNGREYATDFVGLKELVEH